MDFDIEHYLEQEEEIIPYEQRDRSWTDRYYGTLDEKPESERKLFYAQEQFLRTRDMKYWKEMYDISFWYIRSMILKRCTGKIFFEPDEIFDKASAATIEFMQQYLNNPYFEVGASFAGMMKWKVVWVLYKDKNQDQTTSLNQKINNTNKEIGDIFNLETSEDSLSNSYDGNFAGFDFEGFTRELFNAIDAEAGYDPTLEVLVRLYVLMVIRNPKSVTVKKQFIDRFCTSEEKRLLLKFAEELLYQKLKEMLEVNAMLKTSIN